MASKKVLSLLALQLGLVAVVGHGFATSASAQVPPAVAQERVRLAIRKVLGGAQTSGRSMKAMFLEARTYIGRVLPGGAAIFPAALEQFTASANDQGAALWRSKAVKCGDLAVTAGETVPAFLQRAAECLTESIGSTSEHAGVNQLRYIVRQFVAVAQRGSRLLRASVAFLPRLMPAGVPASELMGPVLQQSILGANELTARAFAQQAPTCASLPLAAGEGTLDFARRVGQCISAIAARTDRESVDLVMGRSLETLLTTAEKGVASLRSGTEASLKILDDRVDARVFYPDEFRAALADASPLMTSTVIRGGRRCRMMARGPSQDVGSFSKQVGDCLVQSVAEVSPPVLAALTLRAVAAVTGAAGKGADTLRSALAAADKLLRGKVAPGEVFGGEVRRRIAEGDATWLAQFAQLAPACQADDFRKYHRLADFVSRVNLCLYGAATGYTAEKLQQRILQSIRNVSLAGATGGAALRSLLAKEMGELDKLMSGRDLYTDALRGGLSELSDASARSFSGLGVKCSNLPRGGEENLGPFVQRLAGCLETARVQSGGDVLARRVRDAVGSVIAAAANSSGVLRNSVGPAVALLGGQVAPEQLLPAPLQNALSVATDELAAALAKNGSRCVELPRAPGAPFQPYVEGVARCLVVVVNGVTDSARQTAIRDAVAQLASLAEAGPDALLRGYPELWGKVRNSLPLASTLVQGMSFTQRTAELARRLRAACATMPAATPLEAGNVKACVATASAAALAVLPPDACRGKASMALAECCLQGQNRHLSSCSAHRYACRTGETWQGNACGVPPAPAAAAASKCGPGQMASSTGVCVYIPCQPGEERMPNGICRMPPLCPEGATADLASGRCMIAACPPGTALDPFNRCISGACPMGKVQIGYGVCQPAQCAGSLDAFGRCLSAVPSLPPPAAVLPGLPGMVTPAAAPLVVQPAPVPAMPVLVPTPGMCAPGTVMGPDGRCMRTFCPPGTVVDAYGQCSQGACPVGYVMTLTGQCGLAQ